MDNTLTLVFDGKPEDRKSFLARVRAATTRFLGERMTLEALIIEAAKNIYDHAEKRSSIVLSRTNRTISFEISSHSPTPLSYEEMKAEPRGADNGVNFGAGLEMIESIAKTLEINLQIDDSVGLKYYGTYAPR